MPRSGTYPHDTLGKSAATLSGHRRTSPQKLLQLVRGELDWVVMKSLEKERNRRYESAASFGADVVRFLSGEAVDACPPSRTYRTRKLIQRHRLSVAVAIVVLLLLCLGLLGTSVGVVLLEGASR